MVVIVGWFGRLASRRWRLMKQLTILWHPHVWEMRPGESTHNRRRRERSGVYIIFLSSCISIDTLFILLYTYTHIFLVQLPLLYLYTLLLRLVQFIRCNRRWHDFLNYTIIIYLFYFILWIKLMFFIVHLITILTVSSCIRIVRNCWSKYW